MSSPSRYRIIAALVFVAIVAFAHAENTGANCACAGPDFRAAARDGNCERIIGLEAESPLKRYQWPSGADWLCFTRGSMSPCGAGQTCCDGIGNLGYVACINMPDQDCANQYFCAELCCYVYPQLRVLSMVCGGNTIYYLTVTCGIV